MYKLYLVSALVLLVILTATCLQAMPPHPELVEKWQREGVLDQRLAAMEDLKASGVNNLEGNMLYDIGPGMKIMTIQREAIVIIVDFDDNTADTGTYPASHYDSLLFSVGNYPTGSMRDYYLENSYGNFETVGVTSGWHRMPQDYSYYVDGNNGFNNYPRNAQRLTEDAVNAADPYIDFSQYDNDGPDGIPDSGDDDGFVDALFVVHAGPGAEVTGSDNDIWSHAWATYDYVPVDGVYVYSYSQEPEDGDIGVFCHELGHVLGLPDFYDYGYDSRGAGYWSVMAGGSWGGGGTKPVHFDAYSKARLGFVTPVVPTTNVVNVLVPQVETNAVVYKIWTDGIAGDEYFMLENRQQTGFDVSIKGEGIVIYHVDEGTYGNDSQRCGSGNPHYELAVEQADGECDLEYNRNSGDWGDPWPGSGGTENPNYAFNNTSTPNTRDYNNNPTGVSIYDINMSGNDGYVSIIVGAGDTTDPNVTVVQPNGGENFAIDSFFDIMWTATDDVGVTSIDILLSSDGGATYPHVIATGEANDGIFSWLVDVAPTTQARVKVIAYDAAMNSGEDVSNGNFTIEDSEPPLVTVVQPNGGEHFAIDSFFDIMWTATDDVGVTSIDILLSSDGGATYPHVIATGEVNDGIFSWLVDVAPTTQARVKVLAHDAAGNIGEDASNGNFTIEDIEPPLVTVVQPNGGEHFAIDSFFDIMWTATDNIDVTSIDILLSSDGGATYPHVIATGEPNDGSFLWLVDVAPTTQARVRVLAHDAAGNIGDDASDGNFTIGDVEPPQVTVLDPNGGENWAVDSFFDIMWNATDNIGVTSIDILLSSDGGVTYPHTIAMGEPNDGIFNWLVDVATTTQARIRVVAHDAAGNTGSDVGDADFEIFDGEDPQVNVIDPNGGAYWCIDVLHEIMWDATDNIGVTSIDILLSSDGGATYPHTIATGEANDGFYGWLVDVAPTAQARVKVVAHDAAGNNGEDTSNGDFTIADCEPPLVTVVQPNGGETWAIDSFFDIMWNATDNIGVTSIDILLSSDGGATYPHTIATGEPNDGVFPWLVDVAPTTQARVRVVAHDAAGFVGVDASDADFNIADGQDPEVTVIQPNGGEVWDIDSFFDIMWVATDNIGVTSVDIVLSLDGGGTFPHTIATGEVNDGLYEWLVDSPASEFARVKVIAHDAGGNSGEDVSDADFEVYDPTSGISSEGDKPARLIIAGATPNPFSEYTSVRFGIPVDGRVLLEAYDVTGRQVARLADGHYTAGYHNIEWTGADRVAGTGMYFLRLRSQNEDVTYKIVISR